MIEIDGSQGEGGGQILRTSLTLAACLQKPVRISNIRAGRSVAGLRPQHLVAVRAIGQICGVDLSELSVGRTELTFRPAPIRPGDHTFEIGTAGSTCLVLQTVALPLALAGEDSRVEITGGTHNPKAPCFEYVERIWAPFLARIGFNLDVQMHRAGFYPHGGGRVTARIRALDRRGAIKPLRLIERGELKSLTGVAKIAVEPMNVGYRLVKAASWQLSRRGITGLDMGIEVVEAFDRGGLCFLQLDFEHTRAGFFGISSKAKSPEGAGCDAAAAVADFLDESKSAKAAVDPHAADQLMLALSLAEGPSEYTTSEITEHCITNAAVITQITGRSVTIEGEKGKPGRVLIGA